MDTHPTTTTSISVLHVDDEPAVSNFSEAYLEGEEEEFVVETATNANDALDMIQADPPDCVVSEYSLPEMNGLRLLEAVRELDSDLPFILFTGSGSEEIASDAITAGVTDYLQKDAVSGISELLANRVRDAVTVRETDRIDDKQDGLMEVTEQKHRERKLRRNTLAMDEAPVGITITDPLQDDNPIIYANEKFTDITGYEIADISGKNCRMMQGPGTDQETVAELRDAIENEVPITVELVNYRKDGTRFWNNLHIAPVHDSTGDLVNYVGFQTDITEKKEQQEELERVNNRLVEFTDTVSHDLRNPLTVVLGRIEAAQEDHPDSPHLDPAMRAAKRMNELIEDLLTLARTGQQARNIDPVALQGLADGCWENVATDEASLTVQTTQTVYADQTRLKQLFENLFRNAIEHGGPDVTVTVGALENGFYVEDTGDGIPESERERVFETGYSTNHDGTGFGLGIVKQIVNAHGWQILATESESGGARFEIRDVRFDGEESPHEVFNTA